METNEEWISAAGAVRLLAPAFKNSEYEAKLAILNRAHAGMVRARAEKFMLNDVDYTDLQFPYDFWPTAGAGLTQNWTTGDFELWIARNSIDQRRLRAFNVSFWRADIEKLVPADFVPAKSATTNAPSGTKVFIGHGRSPQWRELKEFIKDELQLPVEEFNTVAPAGMQTVDRISQMLEEAAIGFLVMTAEDKQPDGTFRARENVVHEIGLFQGKHGFKRTIVLLEEGCERFSNMDGLTVIKFRKEYIKGEFNEVRRVLKREGLLRKE